MNYSINYECAHQLNLKLFGLFPILISLMLWMTPSSGAMSSPMAIDMTEDMGLLGCICETNAGWVIGIVDW